jgi:hypothetical protein
MKNFRFARYVRCNRRVAVFLRKVYSMNIQGKALFERLDKIILLLEMIAKQPSLLIKIMSNAATGIGILSIISVIDIIKSWLGG